MNILHISKLNFSYGLKRVVDDFDLEVRPSEIVALVAPSGGGKSTLFRLIAGLHAPESGMVVYLGEKVLATPRKLFLGFQDFDAFPWLTVLENIRMMQRFRSESGDAVDATAIAHRVGLEVELERYPRELSGGMRKRLAFARCLASGARLMLLDEPFSSLDIRSRLEMQLLTLKLVRETGCSVVISTHDAHEAVFLSDRIVVCSGPPLKIERVIQGRPADERDGSYLESTEFQKRFAELTHAIFGEG